MKLISYKQNGNIKFGALEDGKIYDLNAIDSQIADNMLEFLQGGKEQLQLGVAQLVEHAVGGHIAHRRRGSEAHHARLELAGLIFGQGHGAVMQLEHAGPALIQSVMEFGA